MDRRIRKSKNALKKAMFFFMQRKDISKITIRELCEEADVNRSTFYSNYGSISDLIKDLHKDLFDEMFYKNYLVYKNSEPHSIQSNLILQMLHYVEKNKDQIVILFSNNENNQFEQNLLSFFMDTLNITSLNYMESYPFIYHTMAFLTLLRTWINDRYPCNAEELCRIIEEQSIPIRISNQSVH